MASQLGLIGLGTMGSALARNIASRGFKVSLWNRTHEKVQEFVQNYGSDSYYVAENFEDFIESIDRPRRLIVMVPAGEATEEILNQLKSTLREGDCILDGGNAFHKDSENRVRQFLHQGIYFLGTGISGGEEGALKGPSLMAGGSREAWEEFEPILTAISAEDFNGRACVTYMGRGGAGHFVKMVHNGIEYAEMQMLAEAYDFLKHYRLKNAEIAEIFREWDEGKLSSFLTEISIDVLQKEEEGKPLIDLILDKASQKGSGVWVSQEALALGIATPSLTASVFARSISEIKQKRQELHHFYPPLEEAPHATLSEMVSHLTKALLATRVANFEQGYALLKKASQNYEWDLPLQEIFRVWQGGCIIRCSILKDFHAALSLPLESLYFAPFVQSILKDSYLDWKQIVTLGVQTGRPLFALSAALQHFEASRTKILPANFIQALRDRFGAHGYERTDKEGFFHTKWL